MKRDAAGRQGAGAGCSSSSRARERGHARADPRRPRARVARPRSPRRAVREAGPAQARQRASSGQRLLVALARRSADRPPTSAAMVDRPRADARRARRARRRAGRRRGWSRASRCTSPATSARARPARCSAARGLRDRSQQPAAKRVLSLARARQADAIEPAERRSRWRSPTPTRRPRPYAIAAKHGRARACCGSTSAFNDASITRPRPGASSTTA